MDTLGHLVGIAAASPWALVVLAAVLLVDGFFPFVPGETLVVATAAAAGTAGTSAWPILAVAIPAALAGDLLAFHIGRRIGVERWVAGRRPRLGAAFAHAQRRLDANPASILLTAKFLPFVRVAVSMTAGAGRMPLRRYVPLALASVALYTGFHVALGMLVGAAAGTLLGNPLFALLLSIAVGFGVGAPIDLIGRAVRRPGHRPAAGAA